MYSTALVLSWTRLQELTELKERELGGSTINRISTQGPSVGNLVYLTDWLAVQQLYVAVCG